MRMGGRPAALWGGGGDGGGDIRIGGAPPTAVAIPKHKAGGERGRILIDKRSSASRHYKPYATTYTRQSACAQPRTEIHKTSNGSPCVGDVMGYMPRVGEPIGTPTGYLLHAHRDDQGHT